MGKHPILHYINEIKNKLGFSRTMTASGADVVDAVNKQADQIANVEIGSVINASTLDELETNLLATANSMATNDTFSKLLRFFCGFSDDRFYNTAMYTGYLKIIAKSNNNNYLYFVINLSSNIADAITVAYNNGIWIINNLTYQIGDLTDLDTTDNSSLVSAMNELHSVQNNHTFTNVNVNSSLVSNYSWEPLAYCRIGSLVCIHGGIVWNGNTDVNDVVFASGLPRPRQNTSLILVTDQRDFVVAKMIVKNSGELSMSGKSLYSQGMLINIVYVTID